MKRMVFIGLSAVFALSVGFGQTQPTLLVFAASSLTESFGELAKAFDAANTSKTTVQFAGSQILRSQLENGAKADVFASANTAQFDPLLKAGLVVGGSIFTKNRLVVITPKAGTGKVKTLADLGKPGVKLVIADKTVPVGAYTRQVFENLQKSERYGTDFTTRVQKNVVSEEVNVRQVVLKVQLGEADAGLVYSTDVTPTVTAKLIQIAIPASQNVIASYPIGVVKSSSNSPLAQKFVDFVRGGEGQRILAKWGFIPVK